MILMCQIRCSTLQKCQYGPGTKEARDIHATSFSIDLASFLFCSVLFLAFVADRLDGCLSFLLVKVLKRRVSRSELPQPIGDLLHPF